MDHKLIAKDAYSQIFDNSFFDSLSKMLGVDIQELFKYDCLNIISALFLFENEENRHEIELRVDYIFNLKDSGRIIRSFINNMDEEVIVDLIFAQTPYSISYLLRQKDIDISLGNIPMHLMELMEMILMGAFYPDGEMIVNNIAFLLFAYADINKNNILKTCEGYKTLFTGQVPDFNVVSRKYYENHDRDCELFEEISGCDKAERIYSIFREHIVDGKIYELFKISKKSPKVMSYSKAEVVEYANLFRGLENEDDVLIDISNEVDAKSYCIDVDKFEWEMLAILLQYAIGEYGEYKKGHYCEEYPGDYIVLFTIISIIITTGENVETIMNARIEDLDITRGTLTLKNTNNGVINKFKLLPAICQGIIDELISNRSKDDYLFDLNNPVLLWSTGISTTSIDIDEVENEIRGITRNLLGRSYTTKDLQLFGIKYLYLLSHNDEYVKKGLLKNNLIFKETNKCIEGICFDASKSINELFNYLITDYRIEYELYKNYVNEDFDYKFSYIDSPCFTVIDKWNTNNVD